MTFFDVKPGDTIKTFVHTGDSISEVIEVKVKDLIYNDSIPRCELIVEGTDDPRYNKIFKIARFELEEHNEVTAYTDGFIYYFFTKETTMDVVDFRNTLADRLAEMY